MSILVKPLLKCNLKCKYCYEEGIRLHEFDDEIRIDMDEVIKTIEATYQECQDESICAHGGEPTLLPKNDLEKILQKAYEKLGRSSIQTNGTLLDDDHITMFKKYKTGVGISIDGRWPLNELRWAGDEEKTKEMTERTISNIYRLEKEGLTPGLIIVISKANGTKERLPQLIGFLQEMTSLGVTSIRLNLCISEKWGLSVEEARDTYLELCKFTLEDPKRLFQPFRDMVDNLFGLGTGTCVFTKCDFYHTSAGRAILGDGSRTSCLKTAGGGRPFVWDREYSDVRYQILQAIPREEGGCGGCRYWRVCYGFCPSETPGNDWRNRATYCDAYYACYEYIEKTLKGLVPNVILVTDTNPKDENQDYLERRANRWSIQPFQAMIWSKENDNPSTWKSGAKWHVCQPNAKSEQFEKYKQPIPGKPGCYHADHSDQGGCR